MPLFLPESLRPPELNPASLRDGEGYLCLDQLVDTGEFVWQLRAQRINALSVLYCAPRRCELVLELSRIARRVPAVTELELFPEVVLLPEAAQALFKPLTLIEKLTIRCGAIASYQTLTPKLTVEL